MRNLKKKPCPRIRSQFSMSLGMTMKVEHKEEGVRDLLQTRFIKYTI